MSKEAQIAKHNAKLMRRAVAEKHRVEMAGAHKADTAQWQSKNIGDLSLLDEKIWSARSDLHLASLAETSNVGWVSPFKSSEGSRETCPNFALQIAAQGRSRRLS